MHIDKITSRIKKLCYGLNNDFVDPVSITLNHISYVQFSYLLYIIKCNQVHIKLKFISLIG